MVRRLLHGKSRLTGQKIGAAAHLSAQIRYLPAMRIKRPAERTFTGRFYKNTGQEAEFTGHISKNTGQTEKRFGELITY
ncbi:hypothetical protein [Cytobacillus firmus]|uniref:hypothetical protein n=1 Tax=Cytobacillus firmus TaxID=1399 RepID=UPI00202DD475|nr:hypothetical protein [Cytobacillus firmus]URT70811.1 hypothetical protein NAF01_24025 [Cytobacillus firmus]WHY61715.1 hypothetical protein QNH42_24620 [Cytobacillus firmus]